MRYRGEWVYAYQCEKCDGAFATDEECIEHEKKCEEINQDYGD